MATLTIKNISEELYKRLKQSATQHHRSLNSEVIVSLEQALGSPRVDPDDFLVRVRALRERISGIYITEEDLNAAKNEGRL
jgi:plasmid stability protein